MPHQQACTTGKKKIKGNFSDKWKIIPHEEDPSKW